MNIYIYILLALLSHSSCFSLLSRAVIGKVKDAAIYITHPQALQCCVHRGTYINLRYLDS